MKLITSAYGAALLGAAGVAYGSVVGVSGAMELVAAPADARVGAYTSADRVRVWSEQQNHVLERGLWADAGPPGLYDGTGDLGDVLIPAGTAVSSHYIHFDSPGWDLVTAEGSVTFGGRILGVIMRGDAPPTGPARLDESDFLGTGTVYPDGLAYRGLEFQTDSFSISPDGRTLWMSMRISRPGDYARVITAVPAPGAGLLLGAAAMAAGRRRRRG